MGDEGKTGEVPETGVVLAHSFLAVGAYGSTTEGWATFFTTTFPWFFFGGTSEKETFPCASVQDQMAVVWSGVPRPPVSSVGGPLMAWLQKRAIKEKTMRMGLFCMRALLDVFDDPFVSGKG